MVAARVLVMHILGVNEREQGFPLMTALLEVDIHTYLYITIQIGNKVKKTQSNAFYASERYKRSFSFLCIVSEYVSLSQSFVIY